MYASTLVLNLGLPYKVVDWKIAVTNMCRGKYIVVKDYPEILAVIGREAMKEFPELRESITHVLSIEAEAITIRVPAVVQMRNNVHISKCSARFSKTNVCRRDDFKCQYCGVELPISKLTFDHVVPRSQGGRTVWNNIVMACRSCNFHKDNRTPYEANMKLLNGNNHVRKPKKLVLSRFEIDGTLQPEEWCEYTHI